MEEKGYLMTYVFGIVVHGVFQKYFLLKNILK